jgi:hypothetical protein
MSRIKRAKPEKAQSFPSDKTASRIAVGSLVVVLAANSLMPTKKISSPEAPVSPTEFTGLRPAEVVARHSFTPEGNITVNIPTKHRTVHIPIGQFTTYELDLKQSPPEAEIDAGDRGFSTDTYATLNKHVYDAHPVGTSLVVSSTPSRPHTK